VPGRQEDKAELGHVSIRRRAQCLKGYGNLPPVIGAADDNNWRLKNSKSQEM
jgi:hypothetical protein